MPRELSDLYDELGLTSGYIPCESVPQVQGPLGVVANDLLIDLLDIAVRFARPEISSFRVGATALGASGSIYFGANQEFPGSQLVQTVHAEQAATINAYEHGERAISTLAVSAAPCGYCRQFLKELSFADELRVLINNPQGTSEISLEELLPHSFGPADLGFEQGFFGNAENEIDQVVENELSELALNAARRSYAPYTQAFSGVAIETESRIYAGPYIENAAFNPSVSPLQTALVNLALAGDAIESVGKILLVQRAESPIDHSANCRAFAKSLGAEFLLEILCI